MLYFPSNVAPTSICLKWKSPRVALLPKTLQRASENNSNAARHLPEASAAWPRPTSPVSSTTVPFLLSGADVQHLQGASPALSPGAFARDHCLAWGKLEILGEWIDGRPGRTKGERILPGADSSPASLPEGRTWKSISPPHCTSLLSPQFLPSSQHLRPGLSPVPPTASRAPATPGRLN